MFSDRSSSSVGFYPCWKHKSVTVESCTQTADVKLENQITQLPERVFKEVQTEDVVTKLETSPEFNIFTLLAFIQRVAPSVIDQLERNLNSKAFDRYELIGDSENCETEVALEFHHEPWSSKFICSEIAWNSTGSVLALAFGARNHGSWCDHDCGVALWNTGRVFKNGEQAHSSADTECCITAICFHPRLPSVLAIGKFSGVINLFNMFADEDVILFSSDDIADGHREAITGLHWTDNQTLVSCSLDGKILIWKANENMNNFQIVNGFLLLSKMLPAIKSLKHSTAEVGVTCFAFNNEDSELFLVGTEGGAIFQCSLNSSVETHKTLSNGVILKSPVGLTFALHNGYVEDVDFSPNTRNLFLSCSSDGELRIGTLLQPNPIITIRATSAFKRARWSPACPMVLAAITIAGQLCIYDLTVNRSSPSATYEMGAAATALKFNANDTRTVATAMATGKAQLWNLSSAYHTARTNELEKLVALGSLKAHD